MLSLNRLNFKLPPIQEVDNDCEVESISSCNDHDIVKDKEESNNKPTHQLLLTTTPATTSVAIERQLFEQQNTKVTLNMTRFESETNDLLKKGLQCAREIDQMQRQQALNRPIEAVLRRRVPQYQAPITLNKFRLTSFELTNKDV